MRDLSRFQLIMFGGKGGVGKTVCSIASGIFLAEEGRRTLVYSVDPAHSLSDCLSIKIGNAVSKVGNNLFAIEIDAKRMLTDLKRRYGEELSEAAKFFVPGIDLPFEKALFREMLDLSLPGLDEVMALVGLQDMVRVGEYDSIVVDMAAGLHSIRLLGLPELLDRWIENSLRVFRRYGNLFPIEKISLFLQNLRRDIDALKSKLTSSGRSVFVPVTTPDQMAVRVTERIVSNLLASHIPLRWLIVNQVRVQTRCRICTPLRIEQKARLNEIYEKFRQLEIVEAPLLSEHLIDLQAMKKFAEVLFSGKLGISLVKRIPGSYSSVTIKTLKLHLPPLVKLVIFGGKGGCGKTTCAAATGLYMSQKGRKTLVVSSDPQQSLSDLFGQDLSNEITNIRRVDKLFAIQVDAQKLIDEFKEQNREEILEIFSNATYLKKEELMDFLDLSLPGIDEVFALMKLNELVRDGKFDLFVLDTAPTGHTLRLLEVPNLLARWTRIMFTLRAKARYVSESLLGWPVRGKPDIFLAKIHDDVKAMWSLLRSSETTFIPVTTPERISVAETVRLITYLKNVGMNVGGVVVNKTVSARTTCIYCSTTARGQQESLATVREPLSNGSVVAVPFFPNEIMGVRRLNKFAEALYE